MKSIVKTIWRKNKTPQLKLATEEGYEKIRLGKGLKLELEIINKRRCTGFYKSEGCMKPCPKYKKIKSGNQCTECRRKDIYTSWRTGNGTPNFEAEYSVYLAQSGDQVKVGVTKTSRLRNRWLEQGADYATEIKNGLTAQEALKKEKELSQKGLKERIRKEQKINKADPKFLKNKMKELEIETEIIDIQKPFKCQKLVRKGRFPTPVKYVKGKIVSNGRIAMVMTPGRTLQKPRQKGLTDF